MVDIGKRLTAQWKDAVNVVLGLWLIGSPWTLGFAMDQAPTWNAWAVGVVIAVAALAALVAFNKWEEWAEVALGAWLIVSPWVLGFTGSDAAVLTHVLAGIAAIVLAIWSTNEHGAGHLTA